MTDNAEIAQAYDLLGETPMSTIEGRLAIPTPAADAPARVDETGVELKRGAFLNTIAMLASNLRGVFIFLVARLLGPAALGTFSVAWANTDLASKIAVFGLDNAITTFIARSQATGNLGHRHHGPANVWRSIAISARDAVRAGLCPLRAAGHRFVPRLYFHLARHEGDEARHLLARHDRACHHDAGAFDRARLWIHKVRAGGGRRFRNRGFGNCRTHICLKTLKQNHCSPTPLPSAFIRCLTRSSCGWT